MTSVLDVEVEVYVELSVSTAVTLKKDISTVYNVGNYLSIKLVAQ